MISPRSNPIRVIRQRFPGWAQIVAVFGVIAIMIYSWTLLWFFWRVPGWLYYLNAGEILTNLAYDLATNLAESLVVICGPLLLALVLPRKWFRDVFVARGTALCIAGLAYLMVLAYQFSDKSSYPAAFLEPWKVLLVVLGIGLLTYIGGRIAPLRKGLETLADRLSIFAYVLVPISIIGLLVVIVRSFVG